MQMLLHTYYRVADLSTFKVHGVQGMKYLDKVLDGGVSTHEEKTESVQITEEVDRVYLSTPNELMASQVSPVRSIALTKKLKIRAPLAQGVEPQVQEVPCDAVVWNPWVEKSKKTGDLGDEEFHSFVCVEPGAVNPAAPVTCEPGSRVTLSQDIHVIESSSLK